MEVYAEQFELESMMREVASTVGKPRRTGRATVSSSSSRAGLGVMNFGRDEDPAGSAEPAWQRR